MDVEIKTEPMDEEFPVIKQEELIIKSELDDESSENQTQICQSELGNTFDLLIPKDEPVDEECLNESSLPIVDEEIIVDPPPTPPSPKSGVQCDEYKEVNRRLRCRSTNHVCSVCGQVFRTRVILQAHLQRHNQKNSPSKETKTTPPNRRIQSKLPKTSPPDPEGVLYACNTCEMTFADAQTLMNHNRIHGGPRHICVQCGKCFKNANHLRKHRKGDTCAREAIADVLKDTGSDINIKEEVESEDETFTQQMLLGTTIISNVESPTKHDFIVDSQEKNFAIKEERDLVVNDPKIKEEPANSEDSSNDTQGFNDLILQELIDRKAKSIAKEREALNGSISLLEKKCVEQAQKEEEEPDLIDSPSLGHTDFEQVIKTSTLYCHANNEIKVELVKAEPSKKLRKTASQQEDDFEELIESNTLQNFQTKIEVIEDLKEEYQKAKKKKIIEVISTDESSQNSLPIIPMDIAASPCSMYFSLVGDSEPYNELVRKLDKNYRYSWICPSCPRRYVQRHAFIRHLTSSHFKEKNDLNDVLFELRPELFHPITTGFDNYCHLCRVRLTDAASLRKHKNEFHKEDNSTKLQFKCDKCDKICSTRSTLADHVQANCGKEPQYGCDECGKKFHTKSTLNLHKTMHTGELPHECHYCQKRFRTRGQLTVHTRTHTGERPFPCKVCEKRFTHRETLIAHLSRHIDMKRYKCYACQRFFSCISGLKTHRLTRMDTCGKVKLNARPIGPRVRVIKGNVIFEPQPKINAYFRHDVNDSDENTKQNENFQNNIQNQENLNDLVKIEPIPMAGES